MVQQVDNVNHPKHYAGSTSLECIEAMEISFGTSSTYEFCKLNCYKYIWRYKNKNEAEDLQKAQWYYNKAYKLSNIIHAGLYADEQLEVLGRILKSKMEEYYEDNRAEVSDTFGTN